MIKLKLSSQLFGHVTASPSCKQPEKHSIMLSWCPVQRSKASTRVRDRVIMLSWCPVQRSKASARVRDRVTMLSWCPVQGQRPALGSEIVIMLSRCPVQRSRRVDVFLMQVGLSYYTE